MELYAVPSLRSAWTFDLAGAHVVSIRGRAFGT